MALVGRLEDLCLAELFHLLSLFQKSGKLTLNAEDRTGFFVFKKGKLVHAANGTRRGQLGDLLIARGLVDAVDLEKALDIQREEAGQRRIGEILVDLGCIEADVLEGVIRDQLRAITEEFLHRESGFFSFKPFAEGSPKPPTEGDADLELRSGMNSDQFILEILTRLDEVERDQPRVKVAAEVAAEKPVPAEHSEEGLARLLDYMVEPSSYSAEVEDKSEWPTEPAEDMTGLQSLLLEIQLRSPSFTGEITLMILRFATKVVNRGVLFRVSGDGISGIGQFGLESEGRTPADRRIRDMVIPFHEPSVFFEVIENMHTFRGPLKKCKWNDYLAEQLGGGTPAEVVTIPIIVEGMIIAVFYGDNYPLSHAIGSTQGLEILMIEAGLALERRLLRAKLRQLEDQLRAASG